MEDKRLKLKPTLGLLDGSAISVGATVGLITPVIVRTVVALPAPLGPRKPDNSPASTSKSTWSTAVKLPNRLVRSSTSMAFT